MAVCFPKEVVDKVKALNLRTMNSLQRIKAFDEILGAGQGREMNLLYEKSLLLKNQDIAFDRFIDDLTGVSGEKKAAIRNNIKKRLAEKKQAVDDLELGSIIRESVEKRYDIDIPEDVLSRIQKLNREMNEFRDAMQGTPKGSPERIEFAKRVVEVSEIVDELKGVNTSVKDEIKFAKTRVSEAFKRDTLGGIGQTLKETGSFIFNPALKSVKASLDNSILFRQGLKLLAADPKIWKGSAKKTLDIWKEVLSDPKYTDDLVRGFKVDIVSHPYYQQAIDSGLAIGVVEDFFPTPIVQEIPALGRFFKASDESFTMFSQGARMDLFEKYVDLYKLQNAGREPSKDVLKSFARVANSTTGRGGLGSFESSAGLLNKLLFSARYQTANINTFKHVFDTSLSPEARKIASQQAARYLTLVGGLMSTLAMFGDVGFDPKESTFGKFRLPGTKRWVDLTGGLASYFSLGGRMTKSFQQGPKYGKDTPADVLVDFFKGKLAPAPGLARDFLEMRDYSGNRPTLGSAAKSLFIPITLENLGESIADREPASEVAVALFLELVGGSVTEPKARREGSYDFFKN